MENNEELDATEYLMSTDTNKRALDESIKQLEGGKGIRVTFQEVDLTNSELFKSFSEFEHEALYIDLHNEFYCKSILFSNETRQLILFFKPNKYCACKINSVEVVFGDCSIEKYFSNLDKTGPESQTIDMMYRGRFEMNNGELEEVSNNGLYYYYINFLPDVSFELFARSVKANVNII